MFNVWVVPIVLQVVVPILLLAWQAVTRDRTGAAWLLKTLAVTGYIVATAIAGLWLVAPWYTPRIFLIVSVVIAVVRRPSRSSPFLELPHRGVRRLALAGRAVAALASIALATAAAMGAAPPEHAPFINLVFPLRDGTYYIANGGSTRMMNAHVATLDPQFAKYRGQSYGVDILKLDSYGRRAESLAPRELERYAIFGDRIYAPCEGVVVRAEDWLPDLVPPDVDRVHMPGNFVMLECDDPGVFHVLLAHMRSQSLRVHPGDYVTPDTWLGEVGNSGNSNEPHLHVHAQRAGRIWDLFSGDPLPIRFGVHYQLRNDRITLHAIPEDFIDD
jgi:hypothetical protein